MKTFAEMMVGLTAPLDKSCIKTHPYNGQKYIEGYTAIDHANEVFGYDGWSYEIRSIKDVNGDGLYQAVVKVSVEMEGASVSREDVGTCVAAKNRETGNIAQESRETAIKGSVTDALKRALRSFGEQFGNTLYDKEFLAELSREGGQQSYQAPPQRAAQSNAQHSAPQSSQFKGKTQKSRFRLENEKYAKYDISDIPPAPPACLTCGGEMWDNIASPYFKESGGLTKSGKPGPVFTCKNKQCKNSSGFTTCIFPDAYQNGNPGNDYYPTPEDNPYNQGPPEMPPAEVPEEQMSDEAQIVDLEFAAEKVWGPAVWLEELQNMSLAIIGTEEYATAPASDVNKLQDFVSKLKPKMEKAA